MSRAPETEAAELLADLLTRAAQQIDRALGAGVAAANPAMVQSAADGMLKAYIVKSVAALEAAHVLALKEFNATLCKLDPEGLDTSVSQAIAERFVCARLREMEKNYRGAVSELLRKTTGTVRPAAASEEWR